MNAHTSEILRKLLHLGFIWVPVLYYFTNKSLVTYSVALITVIVVITDISRKYSQALNSLFCSIFGPLLRPVEKSVLTGASFMTISALITVLLFSKIAAITALSILIICDSMAALVGKFWGKPRWGNKSLEGSIAFIVSGICVIIIISQLFNLDTYFLGWALLALLASSVAEVLSKKIGIDDNLSIPLVIGSILSLIV